MRVAVLREYGEALAIEEVSDRLAAMTDYETTGVEVVTEF